METTLIILAHAGHAAGGHAHPEWIVPAFLAVSLVARFFFARRAR